MEPMWLQGINGSGVVVSVMDDGMFGILLYTGIYAIATIIYLKDKVIW